MNRAPLIGLLAGCLLCSGAAHSNPESIAIPGFPVHVDSLAGSYLDGPLSGLMVADLDGLGRKSILFTRLAPGPLYVVEHDGSFRTGFPGSAQHPGAAYPSVGRLIPGFPGLQVVVTYPLANQTMITALDGSGQALAGWPREGANFFSGPATLFDLDGDGVDEIFSGENDFGVHGRDAMGIPLAGWPVYGSHGVFQQNFLMPAIADLEGNGDFKVIATNGSRSSTASFDFGQVIAIHADGEIVDGFPAIIPGFTGNLHYAQTADMTGDGADEIVIFHRNRDSDPDGNDSVSIFDGSGNLVRSFDVESATRFGGHSALADFTGDGIPEIITFGSNTISVVDAEGQHLPGWPYILSAESDNPIVEPNVSRVLCNLAVGDLTGDGQPEIASCGQHGNVFTAFVIDRFGRDVAPFPMVLSGKDGNPALGRGAVISDIDGDGSNEVLFMNQTELWALRINPLRHGVVEWAQFGADERRTGRHNPVYPGTARDVDIEVVAPAALTVQPGTAFSFTWTVRNIGTTEAASGSSVVSLPDGVVAVGSLPFGCEAILAAIQCSFGTLVPGAQSNRTVQVCAASSGSASMATHARTVDRDTDTVNNLEQTSLDITGAAGPGCNPVAVDGPRATLEIGADALVVDQSQAIRVWWRSSNTTSCDRVEDNAPVSTSILGWGSHRFSAAFQPKTMLVRVECDGPHGTVSESITLTWTGPAAPPPTPPPAPTPPGGGGSSGGGSWDLASILVMLLMIAFRRRFWLLPTRRP
jgi:hypothetical protein